AASSYGLFWYHQQPYSISSVPAYLLRPSRALFRFALNSLIRSGLTLLLVSLPLLVNYFFGWRQTPKRSTYLSGVLVFSVLWAGTVRLHLGRPPWMQNILTLYGVLLSETEALGERPVILQPWIQTLLALVVFAATSACAMAATTAFEQPTPKPKLEAPPNTAGPATLLLLAGPFSACYWLLVALSPLDRYLIPLLPVVAFSLLWT